MFRSKAVVQTPSFLIPFGLAVLLLVQLAIVALDFYFGIIFLYATVPAIAASLYYLYLSGGSTRQREQTKASYGLSQLTEIKAVSVVALLLFTSSLLATSSGILVLFYFLSALLAAVVFVVIYRHDMTWYPLLLISMLSFTVIHNLTFSYGFYFGGTDTFTHAARSARILSEGAPRPGSPYTNFPLWHIFGGTTHETIGWTHEPHRSLQLLNLLIFSLAPVVLFAAFQRNFQRNVLLFAGLILVLSETFIYYGGYSVARGVVPLLVLLLFFNVRWTIPWIIATLLVLTSIVVYHPASPPFVAILLGVFAAVSYVVDDFDRLFPNAHKLLFALFIVVLTYWSFVGTEIVLAVATMLLQPLPDLSGAVVPEQTVVDAVVRLYQFLPYSIILFLLFSGFVIEYFETEQNRLSLLIVVILFAAISYPNPLTMIERLGHINVHRFGLYAMPFIALGAGYSLSVLVNQSTKRILVVLCSLILILTLITVSHGFLSFDRTPIGQDGPKAHFDDAEQNSIEHALMYTPSFVFSDNQVTRYTYTTPEHEQAHILIYNPEVESFILPPESTVLLREGELETRGLTFYTYDRYVSQPHPSDRANTWDTVRLDSQMAKQYTNGDNVIYESPDRFLRQ